MIIHRSPQKSKTVSKRVSPSVAQLFSQKRSEGIFYPHLELSLIDYSTNLRQFVTGETESQKYISPLASNPNGGVTLVMSKSGTSGL